MISIARSLPIATLMLGLVLVACGPDESQTHVEVTTKGGDKGDTVIKENTVIQERTDTVVKENTVIQKQTDTVVKTVPGTTTPPSVPEVGSSERTKIDAWLAAYPDSLNQYGDPKGTMYAGGNPTFDEASGKALDRYAYIVIKHSDKPWNRPLPAASKPRGTNQDATPSEAKPRR